MHRRTGTCYKHCITAENSTAWDSSYIKKGFILWIRFVETGLGWFDEEKKRQMGKWGGGGKLFQNLKRWERM